MHAFSPIRIAFFTGALAAGFSGCKTAPASSTKDIGLSPSDISAAPGVIWLASDKDKKVHAGKCPSETRQVDRNCPGLTENHSPLDTAEYERRLTLAVMSQRTGQTITVFGDQNRADALAEKIGRLSAKLSAGGLTSDEAADLTRQVDANTKAMDAEKAKLATPEDKKKIKEIMTGLELATGITVDEGENNFDLAQAPFGMQLSGGVAGGLRPPPAGTAGNKIKDIAAVVNYMKLVKGKFYDTGSGYSAGSPLPPPATEPGRCNGACPSYYSTLVCQFYCLHPGYDTTVIPNVRGCFSPLSGATVVNGRGMYPEIFDYCMYQEYDATLQARNKTQPPPYNAATITSRKASNQSADRVGVLKYMTPGEEEVFKYIMYTWYNPFAFDPVDQQSVLDQVYGAGVIKVNPTRSKHPKFTEIETFMKDWDKNGR